MALLLVVAKCRCISTLRGLVIHFYAIRFQTIVEEQMAHSADLLKVRRVHYIPDIANTLYADSKLRTAYSSQSSINEMLSYSSSVPGNGNFMNFIIRNYYISWNRNFNQLLIIHPRPINIILMKYTYSVLNFKYVVY